MRSRCRIGLVGKLIGDLEALGEEDLGPLDLAQIVPAVGHFPHLQEPVARDGRNPGLLEGAIEHWQLTVSPRRRQQIDQLDQSS